MRSSPFSERLTFILESVSLGCMVVMTILVVAQVFFRYVLNYPLTWSEELARIIFIFLTFLGIGAAYGRRRHMFIDSFINLLPPFIKKAFECFVVVIASAFLVVILIVTIQSMVELSRMEFTTPALEIPMVWVYLAIPLGGSGLIVQMWIQLFPKKSEGKG